MKEMNILEVVEAVRGKVLHYNELSDSALNRMTISSVSTNSREIGGNGLFVPIIGEKVDGHSFIEDAYRNGAVACFTSRDEVYHEGLVCIRVEDTLRALQDLARCYREQFNIPVIGITGSVGKTSTKEMVSGVLSTRYNVLKTEGNMNSQVGLPLMMFRIEEDHDMAVIEMGISEEGEMDRLVKIAQPTDAILTNIGVSHIGQLKTQENIRKEKLNIINEFTKTSRLFINGDDDLLYELKLDSKNKENSQKFDNIDLNLPTKNKLKETEIISFGTKEINDYRAIDIKVIYGQTHFRLTKKDSKETEDIGLNVLGGHNVNNALCALAVAKFYNIPVSIAKKGLEGYKSIPMRGQVKDVGGITIIDDTYNASPDSMKSSIQVLASIENVNRKVAVLADVLELGSISHKVHKEVGEFIAGKDIDEVVTIGTEASYIAQGINSKDKNISTHSFNNNGEAINYLGDFIKPGDALLVKGSRGMKTEEIVNFFIDKYK